MPNVIRQQEIHLGVTGNPNTYNAAAPYMPGQVGNSFEWNGNTYTLVQLDPNATTPAVGQLFFWMTKGPAVWQVTNVKANAINGATTNGWRNEPAGILMNAATAGNYVCILVQGANIPVATLATNAVGDLAIADITANVGNALNIAAGTAPTYETIGIFRSISASNLANVDVWIPTLT